MERGEQEGDQTRKARRRQVEEIQPRYQEQVERLREEIDDSFDEEELEEDVRAKRR